MGLYLEVTPLVDKFKFLSVGTTFSVPVVGR